MVPEIGMSAEIQHKAVRTDPRQHVIKEFRQGRCLPDLMNVHRKEGLHTPKKAHDRCTPSHR